MGTKNNPGAYDCYAKLEPDEPHFVLRGRDPAGSFLVEVWRLLRANCANLDATLDDCVVLLRRACGELVVQGKQPLPMDNPKSMDARGCAKAMLDWAIRKRSEKLESKLAGEKPPPDERRAAEAVANESITRSEISDMLSNLAPKQSAWVELMSEACEAGARYSDALKGFQDRGTTGVIDGTDELEKLFGDWHDTHAAVPR